jgi:hypothetical protein
MLNKSKIDKKILNNLFLSVKPIKYAPTSGPNSNIKYLKKVSLLDIISKALSMKI